MARTKRYRMRYDFQLNVAKDDELAVAEQITNLKTQGLYSKTVRDGIRLVSDLREGNLDVLFELFPWVRAEFLEYVASAQPQKSDTEINIQKQLARIEELLANGEAAMPAPKIANGAGGPKGIKAPAVAGPLLDDDNDVELTIKKTKTDGKQSAQNFLASAFALQG